MFLTGIFQSSNLRKAKSYRIFGAQHDIPVLIHGHDIVFPLELFLPERNRTRVIFTGQSIAFLVEFSLPNSFMWVYSEIFPPRQVSIHLIQVKSSFCLWTVKIEPSSWNVSTVARQLLPTD